MFYDLREVLKELERTDKKLQRGAYQEGEIQNKIDEMRNFHNLLVDIQKNVVSLQEASEDDVNRIVNTLSELEATLKLCNNHIEEVQDTIRQLLLQFSREEKDTLLSGS